MCNIRIQIKNDYTFKKIRIVSCMEYSLIKQ